MSDDDRRGIPPSLLTTGLVASLLGTTEPRLSDAVRRGRISPTPQVVAGRRLWTPGQVAQAAAALGLPLDATGGHVLAGDLTARKCPEA